MRVRHRPPRSQVPNLRTQGVSAPRLRRQCFRRPRRASPRSRVLPSIVQVAVRYATPSLLSPLSRWNPRPALASRLQTTMCWFFGARDVTWRQRSSSPAQAQSDTGLANGSPMKLASNSMASRLRLWMSDPMSSGTNSPPTVDGVMGCVLIADCRAGGSPRSASIGRESPGRRLAPNCHL